jgi:hypothetical protein
MYSQENSRDHTPILLDEYLGEELLIRMVRVGLTSLETARLFSKIAVP